MNYISVCSGIEAATVAWHPLGWTPLAFAEIEKFPSAVLKHHYPHVPNYGDLTKFHEWPIHSIDVLAGGTPCQAFSVAGLRAGLADPRGNLTLTFLGVAEKYRPRWIVWENVPGVLSSVTTDHPEEMAAPDDLREGEERECVEDYEADSSHALSCFLDGLKELGYGCAMRCLDAQYFGLAQRRKRVFVVASLGGWERAAAVLFEPESVRGDSAPSREAGQEPAAGTLRSTQGGSDVDHARARHVIPIQEIGKRQSGNAMNGVGHGKEGDPMYTLQRSAIHGVAFSSSGDGYWSDGINALRAREQESHEKLITHSLRGEGFDASEDGTGRGTPLVAVAPLRCNRPGETGLAGEHTHLLPAVSPALNTVSGSHHAPDTKAYVVTAFSCKDHGADAGEISPTLRAMGHSGSHANAGGQVAVAFHPTQDPIHSSDGTTHALGCGSKSGQASVAVAFQESQSGCREYDNVGTLRANGPGHDPVGTRIRAGMSVRRLTPKECERLQGFPDNYTLIPTGKRPAHLCPDGPRYKALGNSMAVPCMRYIGERINLIDQTIP